MLWAVSIIMVALSGTNAFLQHEMKDLRASPQILGLFRMLVTGVQAYIFTAIAGLFPVLERGTAFAVVLTISRFLSCSAPLIAEYSENPAILMLLTSVLSLVSVAMTTTPNGFENILTDRYVQLRGQENVRMLESSLEHLESTIASPEG